MERLDQSVQDQTLDAPDVWGAHGVGGFLGIVLVGVFASTTWNRAATGGVDGLVAGNPGFFGLDAIEDWDNCSKNANRSSTVGCRPVTTMFSADAQAVSPGYFETLGIPILRGRAMTSNDRRDTEPVAVARRSGRTSYAAAGLLELTAIGTSAFAGRAATRIDPTVALRRD